MAYYNDWGFRPYVPVAQRRRDAAREMQKLKKQGRNVAPVHIEGRTIARTFWGKAWCENLEGYSDYANRLPRGRTYVRNGSVVDLQIAPGAIEAFVSGSDLYKVEIKVAPVSKARWKLICGDCAGAIDSLVELLRGQFSKGVMERICRQNQGLFPAPAEIRLSCSCPDWAGMCKHVAAVLYGVGARFDHQPELLFLLREVNKEDLIAKAGQDLPLTKQAPAAGKILGGEDLAGIFGLDMAQSARPGDGLAGKPKTKRPPAKKAAAPAKKAAVPAKTRQPRKQAVSDRKRSRSRKPKKQ